MSGPHQQRATFHGLPRRIAYFLGKIPFLALLDQTVGRSLNFPDAMLYRFGA